MRGTEREREAETQAEGEARSRQGARRGTRSQVSRPWAEGGAKPLSHPGCPQINKSLKKLMLLKKKMLLKNTEWHETKCKL